MPRNHFTYSFSVATNNLDEKYKVRVKYLLLLSSNKQPGCSDLVTQTKQVRFKMAIIRVYKAKD